MIPDRLRKGRNFIAAYAVVTVLYGLILVLLHKWTGKGFCDELLVLLIVPVLYAAFHFERRIYIPLLFICGGVSYWVVINVVANLATSIQTLIIILATVALSSETIRRAVIERKRLQEESKQGEEKFRVLTQTIPAATFIHQGGHFRSVNPAFETISGYSIEELQNMDFWEVVHPDFRDLVRDRGRLRSQGESVPSRYEVAVLDKNGEKRWVDLTAAPIDLGGEKAVLGTFIDITERKQMEEALRESEERYRILFESAGEGILVADIETKRFVYANPAICKMLGYGREELLQLGIADIHPEEVANRVMAAFHSQIEDESKVAEEISCLKKDGSILYVDISVAKATIDDRPSAVGFFSDVTQRRETTEKLRFQSLLLNQIGDLITATDLDGRITYVNEAECRLMKRRPEELIGRSVETYGDNPKRGATQREIIEKTLSEGEWRGEIFNQASDGTEIIVDCRTWLIRDGQGKPTGMCGIATDVTEQKKAQDALRESETKYRELVENANSIILRMDTDGNVTFFNEFAQEFFGYSEEEILGRNVIGTIVPETSNSGKDLREMVSDIGQNPERYAVNENENMRRNGEKVWVAWTNKPILDEEGNATGILCVGNDISQQKRVEEERRALHRLSQRLSGPLTLCDIALVVAEESRALFEHDAFSFSIIDLDRWELISAYNEDTPRGHTQPVEVKIEIGSADSFVGEQRLVNRPEEPDTSEFVTFGDHGRLSRSLMFAPICWENKRVGMISVQSYIPNKYSEEHLDLLSAFSDQCAGAVARSQLEEEAERLEVQLRQAHKMEAIGQLAGGVAHNINNLLTGIMGNLSLIQLKSPEDIRGNLASAQLATDRVAELVQQLLAFSRKVQIHYRSININEIVEEVFQLARQIIDRRIEMDQRLEPDLPVISGDPSQLNSVFMNMFLNARDAVEQVMSEKVFTDRRGDRFLISLETKRKLVDREYCQNRSYARPGCFVVVSISDNGAGMDAETQEHVFEPFFSTKEVGRGTGLGLASAYGIVKQHSGWIDFSSEYGKGSRFDIYLPCAEVTEETEEKRHRDQPSGGKETILLVDDEAVIREVGKTILETLGYHVIVAEDGEEALDIYHKRHEEIDLLILDLSMPRLSGNEMLEQLRTTHPEAKVVISSGYAEDSQRDLLERLGVLGYAAKPYRVDELGRVVREALDA